MEYITLNNGVEMPMLGYGTFQIPAANTARCVLDAISVGYRSIDTAQGYFNEEGVGEAVSKCGIAREELFLTTKIWVSNSGYDRAKTSIDASLRKLKTGYVDLMLIHQPFGDYYGSYRAMEEAYKAGKIRAIGVSNFMPDRFIDIAGFMEITPAVNQLEVHVFQQQKIAREILQKHGTQLMAWSPLAQGKNGLFTNETLTMIGEKYGKTAAQVNLRFLIQSGIVIIPKSTHRERMEENFALFDFKLTDEEMCELKTLDLGRSQFIDHHAPEVAEMFVGAGKM
ncbi:aldo/keto reductase [Butyricicoccus faecihominis]|uniref:aldo/keto reductase n=1 Tax=Butyricicoccaceae TaxID=3085642 RepID=UPI00247A6107|nr:MULTISPECIES: aldo/keto reductase [Butyricicoccaceae]MCQ5131213.1 aldo/keto reductase [Butyricicoccus faecihominis]WNX84472.1 aldo/keto reductase [Agathobaculum sp. NTUH-O15-33]